MDQWKVTQHIPQSRLFLSGFLFMDTDDSHDSRVKEGRGPSFIPLYYFHLFMNIQTFIATLHIWNDYRILVAPLVSTRLLLNEIKRIIELPSDWLMWLASTITLVLQADRLTKCTNHPNCYFQWSSGKIIQSIWHKTQQFVGNKAKGRMLKRVRKKTRHTESFEKLHVHVHVHVPIRRQEIFVFQKM